jgi:hypothetical protein
VLVAVQARLSRPAHFSLNFTSAEPSAGPPLAGWLLRRIDVRTLGISQLTRSTVSHLLSGDLDRALEIPASAAR